MHNTKLQWLSDDTREEHNAKGWRVNWNGSFVQVTGDCPRCKAAGQTEFTAQDGDLGDMADEASEDEWRSREQLVHMLSFHAKPKEYVLRMECRCGDDIHGKGKNGCGAIWNVRVSR